MNKQNKKGFTLAELLIVVAIIAVLVAIGIPIFNSQLEKSRESTDLANVRSKYAEIMMLAISEEVPEAASGITLSGTTYTAEVELKQIKSDWQMSKPIMLGGVEWNGSAISGKWEGTPGANGKCTISYSFEDGICYKWSGDASEPKSVSIVDSTKSYVGVLTNESTAKKLASSGSYCFNSTCTNNSTIKSVAGTITDSEFLSTMVTWAVVRDTNKTVNEIKTNTYNNYLFSSFDISEMTPGSYVPAIYFQDGKFYVGNATVAKAPDIKNGNYNIITKDLENNYAYTYDDRGNSQGTDKSYRYDNLLKDKTEYTSEAEAIQAYKLLAAQYMDANPEITEGSKK